MQFGEETKRLHARLAAANRELREHVERHPDFLERSRFAALDSSALTMYRLQAWPTFLDTAAVREVTRVTVAVNRLLKSVPERFFGNDPEALAEYYGQEEKLARVIATLLGRPDHLETLLARGDFIEDEAGFQCLEVNLSSNVGGWQTLLWDTLYRATSLQEFLRASGLRVSTTDTMRALFEHLVEHAARAGLGQDAGELNLLFAIPPEKLGQLVLRDIVDQIYGRHLEEAHGWRGRVLVASYEELAMRGDALYLGDDRIHIAVEHYGSVVPREVLFPFLSGNLLLVNGPVSQVLDDRRNLALLSEYQDSDYFDAEERAFIHRHVPWTRFVVRDYTDYQGERVPLPDMLRTRRERMILKHVASTQGEKVLIGAAMSPEAWDTAVEAAVQEGRWIVQERVDSLPYWYQTGEVGCAPHDLVWGFFVFGDRYGGGFLRMKPSGSHGIVNSAQGAEEGILFEVDPSAGKEERP